MNKDLGFRPGRGCSVWVILGVGLGLLVGIGLTWYGFTRTGGGQRATVQPSATLPATSLPSPVPTLPPTDTPPPTFTLQPTPVPPTATPAISNVVAGADGANVRTGPGINFSRVGYLDPGAQARVIGRYGGWWQIDYGGSPGWVYGEIVTPANTESVSEVQPPPSPTPVPPTATLPSPPTATSAPAAPTATPGPPAGFRGLVPKAYWVENAPGPFGDNSKIWFNMEITNATADRITYNSLGTWVEETGQFQESWTNQKFSPNQQFEWRDHIRIPDEGTYHLWMRICFTDGACVNMMGPVEVKVN